MSQDYSKLSRAEKLYILSQICIQNSLVPSSPTYTGLIIRVCTSKFSMSTDAAKEYATDLASAYRADFWEGLAQAHQTESESAPEGSTPRKIEPHQSILDSINFKSTEPIKHVDPQPSTNISYAPVTVAQILTKIAKQNDFNGVGRVTLAEARYELADRSLQLWDVASLLKQFNPKADIEYRPGNLILIYFDGKNNVMNERAALKPVVPELPNFEKEEF